MCGWGIGKLFFFFHFILVFLKSLEPCKLLRNEDRQGPNCGKLWGVGIIEAGTSGKG